MEIGKHETETILPNKDNPVKTTYTVNPHIFLEESMSINLYCHFTKTPDGETY